MPSPLAIAPSPGTWSCICIILVVTSESTSEAADEAIFLFVPFVPQVAVLIYCAGLLLLPVTPDAPMLIDSSGWDPLATALFILKCVTYFLSQRPAKNTALCN